MEAQINRYTAIQYPAAFNKEDFKLGESFAIAAYLTPEGRSSLILMDHALFMRKVKPALFKRADAVDAFFGMKWDIGNFFAFLGSPAKIPDAWWPIHPGCKIQLVDNCVVDYLVDDNYKNGALCP